VVEEVDGTLNMWALHDLTWILYICTKGGVSKGDSGVLTISDSARRDLFAECDDNE